MHIVCAVGAYGMLRLIVTALSGIMADVFNLLTANVNYSGRTAPLTS